MNIIENNLYESILVNPFESGDVNTLNIVSGYATSAMAFHHLNHFAEKKHNINVNLIVGMVPRDGIIVDLLNL